MKITKQMKIWMGDFGQEYTLRNTRSLEEVDEIWCRKRGISRTKLNYEFLDSLPRSLKILEVGANIGNQLLFLRAMDFENLYGIEINDQAILASRKANLDIIKTSVFDIPFKDGWFDLVFTSGILIHIAPNDIRKALIEIYRCTQQYIWGYEFYADEYIPIIYRGKKNLLWKTNFVKLYLDLFKDLILIKEKEVKYLKNKNRDVMFLLEKKGEVNV